MASRTDHAANAWLAMESRGRSFEASGAWGHARGTITPPATGVRRGWLMGGTRSQAPAAVVLVVPNAPEMERLDRILAIEDAMSAGLSRGGAHVARVRECTLTGSVFDDAELAVEAALGMADAASAQGRYFGAAVRAGDADQPGRDGGAAAADPATDRAGDRHP